MLIKDKETGIKKYTATINNKWALFEYEPKKNIIEFNSIPLVSTDFNHNPASAIYDSNLTKVMSDKLLKVYVWYDNEWGFSNRMLDVTVSLMNAK